MGLDGVTAVEFRKKHPHTKDAKKADLLKNITIDRQYSFTAV